MSSSKTNDKARKNMLSLESLRVNPFRLEDGSAIPTNKKQIGKSTNGTVYEIEKVHPNDKKKKPYKVALKVIPKSHHHLKIYKEVNVMKALNHRNVLKLIDCFETSKSYCIITKLCLGGTLHEWMVKRKYHKNYSTFEVLTVFKQIFDGLDNLHGHNIIHRDLKPQNIFFCNSRNINPSGLDLDLFSIKIGDFGDIGIIENKTVTNKQIYGTLYYMSPEILNQEPYNEKVDIWAVGIMLYEIVTGFFPFNGNDKDYAREVIKANIEFYNIEWEKDEEGLKIAKQCLQRDFEKRPSTKTLLESKWVKKFDDSVAGVRKNFNPSEEWKKAVKKIKQPDISIRRKSLFEKINTINLSEFLNFFNNKEEKAEQEHSKYANIKGKKLKKE